MFECVACGRELGSDANYCDLCGSPQQARSGYAAYSPVDVALDALTTLVQLWNNIPEPEKVAITSAITTYLLTKSSEAFMYLRDWLAEKENESSPLDATT
jgi:hypothetical protein